MTTFLGSCQDERASFWTSLGMYDLQGCIQLQVKVTDMYKCARNTSNLSQTTACQNAATHQTRNITECTTMYENKFQAWRNFIDPRLKLWGRRVRKQDGMRYQYLYMQIREWRIRGMKLQHRKAQGTVNFTVNFKTYLERDPVPISFTLYFKRMRFWLVCRKAAVSSWQVSC